MPTFAAITLDAFGHRRNGLWEAVDEPSLRHRLRAESLWPLRISRARPNRTNARLRLPPRDLVALLHQLELQVRAGQTADAAIAQLAADLPRGPARTMLAHIHREVAQGSPIHAACRTFEKIFPPELAAVIAAGEASAQLPEALRALAAHVTHADELKRTARRALIYPAVVTAATSALIVFLLTGVVPKFAEIFQSLHIQLPALTRALIRTSEFFQSAWPLLLATAGVLFLAFVISTRAPRLKYLRDRLLLQVPVFGETQRCLATARFAAHVRLMHEAGVPLLSSLATGAEVTGHAVLAREILRAREGIATGCSLAAALPPKHSFPAFVVPALRAGETTGQLGAALRHVEDYATSHARERLATALALLEPVLLTFLTSLVGAIALSFFLPLFALLGGINAR